MSSATESPASSGKRDSWKRRLLRSKLLWTGIFFLVLISFGVERYRELILAPPERDWGPVAVEDLSADQWYQSERGRALTQNLGEMMESPPIRLAMGIYYHEYRRSYASGVRNTQLVRVGPDQYPEIWEMAVRASEVLAVDPVPQVYLGFTGKRSVEVTNHEVPLIVIGDSFLWAFEPSELRYLIGRKIGNIACRHVFLLDVVKGVRSIVDSALPTFVVRIILGSIGGELLAWLKEAEITADRAGLLVTADVDSAANAIIKLNIHASVDTFYGPANPEAYARQVEVVEETRLATTGAVLAEIKNPNPFATIRVADLLKWYEANSSLFMDRKRDRAGVRSDSQRLAPEVEGDAATNSAADGA